LVPSNYWYMVICPDIPLHRYADEVQPLEIEYLYSAVDCDQAPHYELKNKKYIIARLYQVRARRATSFQAL